MSCTWRDHHCLLTGVQVDHRPFTEPEAVVSHMALKLSGALFRHRQISVDEGCLAQLFQGSLLAGYFLVELYCFVFFFKVLILCLLNSLLSLALVYPRFMDVFSCVECQ